MTSTLSIVKENSLVSRKHNDLLSYTTSYFIHCTALQDATALNASAPECYGPERYGPDSTALQEATALQDTTALNATAL